MNEKTKQRLESELNVPAPTQPVDKLRIHEAHAAEARLATPANSDIEAYLIMSFADDE